MSYILVVWEQPIPSSMAEVGPLLSALRADKAVASSARVDAFMSRLWEKYPRDLDVEDEDYVWDDSFASTPQPRPRLIYLSISFSHIDEVMPFVLRLARENGLVVHDSEGGTVFLPSGLFLGNTPQPLKTPAPRAFDGKSAQRELIALLGAAFKPLGFRWAKIQAWDSRFVRKFDGGWQSVEPKIDIERDPKSINVDFLLSAFLDSADLLLGVTTGTTQAADAFVAATKLSGFIARTRSEGLKEFERNGSAFVLRGREEIGRFAKASAEFIKQALLPLLDQYRSMPDYGRHVLDRTSRNEPSAMSEPTIVRIAAVTTAVPSQFEAAIEVELAAYGARIAALEAMVPPRPAQVAAERNTRARIEAFAEKHRRTLG